MVAMRLAPFLPTFASLDETNIILLCLFHPMKFKKNVKDLLSSLVLLVLASVSLTTRQQFSQLTETLENNLYLKYCV